MSFILDALRKSDAERQRTVTPGLSDVRYATRRERRNIWLPILAVVLAANAVFMAVQWLRRDGDPPAATAATAGVEPTGAVPATATPSPPAPAVPTADIRPLAREAEFGEPLPDTDVESEFAAPLQRTAVPAPVVMEAPEPGVEPASSQPAPPAARPSRILASDDLPTAEQLMGSGSLNIPVLNLDLHVYSESPAARFVIINSHKYKEGNQLSEGPTVEGITSEGVILSNQGQRFTLDRK